MARITTSQYFLSVRDLCEKCHVAILPKPRFDWRLLKEPFVGEIIGLPTLRGIAVATNGIIVAIIQGDDSITFGHLDNFIPDNQCDESVKLLVRPAKASKTTSIARNMAEFV